MRAKLELVQLAAAHLLKSNVTGPEWQGDHSLKVCVASQVSKDILKRRDPNLQAEYYFVQVEWITRNRHPIQQRRMELAASI